MSLYPLGFGLDNWTEETWIRSGWSAGDGRRELIPMAFAAAATITPSPMVFGCGAFVDTLPYDSALLEESLAFMGIVEDQQKMVSHDTLVHHPKNPLFPSYDFLELLRRCENIILSFSSLRHQSYRIVHGHWRTPLCGVHQMRKLSW
jgi:hypothetical protein